MNEPTPMMQQYRRLKENHRDAVLFFRLGDFYEMFEEDAREVSALLNLTLTARQGVPMCGIPYHAAQSYIARLLKAGKKIAICEQITLPEKGKGLADRQVIEIITPGTVVEEDYLDRNSHNYLVALGRYKEFLSLSCIDLSTATFFAEAFSYEQRKDILRRELSRLDPAEILVQETLLEEDPVIAESLSERKRLMVNRYPDWSFDVNLSYERLKKQLGVSNLKGFGFDYPDPALFSCGILLEYVGETSRSLLPHIKSIERYNETEYLLLDEATQKNLEIVRNLQDGGKSYTLLEVLDFTKTSMGGRKIQDWLLHPLRNKEKIESRLDKVTALYKNQMLLSNLREKIAKVLDLERLSAKLALDKAHAKDLLALKASLFAIAEIRDLMTGWEGGWFQGKSDEENFAKALKASDLIERGIAPNPSVVISEGNLIKEGYNKELDELKAMQEDGNQVLMDYLEEEKRASGIASLKVRYNRIIGYYLEVTKSNLSLVPRHFIRKQSLVGGERYTTERLIEIESAIHNASERSLELEKELFFAIREEVKAVIPVFLSFADTIGEIDCIQSFAYAATRRGYFRPRITEGGGMIITGGRHPVVEAHLPAGEFIPNSIRLGTDETTFALITGPNMAGKSTYLRQTALIIVMAQAGSFVPAQEASLCVMDKVFCRVGAQDNLARGESTFLVEMNETAHILRSATPASLIIMDEVGRGTGTNDGLAIAQAVLEFIIESRIKTLFATHYHELTRIESPRLMNLSLEVLEREDEIIFLKRIKEGAAENSYGIHVAKIAGLPEQVIVRAREILASIEGMGKKFPAQKRPFPAVQEKLFSEAECIVQQVLSLDVNRMTPIEALNTLSKLKEQSSRIIEKTESS